MTTDELRRALDIDGKLIGRGGIEHPFVTAARSWLTLQEGNPTNEMIADLEAGGWLVTDGRESLVLIWSKSA